MNIFQKNEINKFSEFVGEYGFNNLTYYNEEKQLKMDYYIKFL